MSELQRLTDIEALKHLKAVYFRGVDTSQSELVRDLLAEDCVLDYTDCFVDPTSGHDFLSTYSQVVRGRAAWPKASLKDAGIVSVHQGHTVEVDATGDTGRAIWAMTDRLYMPSGGRYSQITGYGHYHETYERIGGAWKIKTLRLTRLRVEGS
jgi:hypothetical protein